MTRGIFLRHVLREVALATLVVGVVLLAVLVIYQLAFVLGRAADGQVPGDVVLHLVALSLRTNLTVILPFAVLLGIVTGLGRLYHDSEITAAQACGVGQGTLFAAAGIVVLAVGAFASWNVFVDAPAAARDIVELRVQALRTAMTRGLAPGQFRPLGRGATLHFRAAGAGGALEEVFVQRELPARADGRIPMQVVVAARARYAVTADSSAWVIELADGHSYEGVPGAADWRITAFRAQTIRVPTPEASLPGRPRVDVLDNRALLGSDDPRRRGELHWRIAWVLNVLLLGLVAVPLARLRPRQGRHARVPWAVLLFAVYAGLLSAGRSMLERGDVPPAWGLWWVHAAVLLFVWLLLGAPRWLATAVRGRRRAGQA